MVGSKELWCPILLTSRCKAKQKAEQKHQKRPENTGVNCPNVFTSSWLSSSSKFVNTLSNWGTPSTSFLRPNEKEKWNATIKHNNHREVNLRIIGTLTLQIRTSRILRSYFSSVDPRFLTSNSLNCLESPNGIEFDKWTYLFSIYWGTWFWSLLKSC